MPMNEDTITKNSQDKKTTVKNKQARRTANTEPEEMMTEVEIADFALNEEVIFSYATNNQKRHDHGWLDILMDIADNWVVFCDCFYLANQLEEEELLECEEGKLEFSPKDGI
mmetsp:Transcript_10695/g.15864  ORF Transcript_10695/g.15864 Transcript_10695/m.15864 type:complete len:112 (-) Transcript_10695:471-806(-)